MTWVVRAVEAIEKKRHPGRAAFEKSDADFWETFEDAVGEQPGGLNRDTERMAEGVHRIIGAKAIHAKMVQRADMHRQGAAEFLRLFVNRPVQFRTQMIFDAFAVGRQHAAQHAELFY